MTDLKTVAASLSVKSTAETAPLATPAAGADQVILGAPLFAMSPHRERPPGDYEPTRGRVALSGVDTEAAAPCPERALAGAP